MGEQQKWKRRRTEGGVASSSDSDGDDVGMGLGVAPPSYMDAAADELIDEVLIDDSDETCSQVESVVLDALRRAMVDAGPKTLSTDDGAYEASSLIHALAKSADPSRPALTFEAGPPEAFQIVGSYALDTAERGRAPCVDVALILPAGVCTPKDFLSYRYFIKRAMYLEHVASCAQTVDAFTSVAFAWQFNDPTKPVLALRARGLDVEVRLMPCVPEGTFDLAKLHPGRSNIRGMAEPLPRPKDWRPAKAGDGDGANAPDDADAITRNANGDPTTPRYSHAICEDATMVACHAHAGRCLMASPGLRRTAVLLKVWARQSGLSLPAEGLSGFFFTMLSLWAFRPGHLASSVEDLTPMQALRVALEALAGADLAAGASMHDPDESPDATSATTSAVTSPPPPAAFAKAAPCVLTDPATGRMNLAGRVSPGVWGVLTACVGRTLGLLDSALDAEAKFAKLFLVKASPQLHYDYHFLLSLNPKAGGEGGWVGDHKFCVFNPALYRA